MAKWLSIVVVIAVLFLLMKRSSRRGVVSRARAGETRVEDMVRCHVCGVNLPRSEAILSRGRFYCGEEHRRMNGV